MYYDIPKLKSHQPTKLAGTATAVPAPPPLSVISLYLRFPCRFSITDLSDIKNMEE